MGHRSENTQLHMTAIHAAAGTTAAVSAAGITVVASHASLTAMLPRIEAMTLREIF